MLKKLNTPAFAIAVLLAIYCIDVNADVVTESDVVGSYGVSYGGVAIFENNTFAIIALGTILRGKWELQGNLVTFTTHKEQLFRLYGRKLSQAEKPNQIRFGGFFDREVSMAVNPRGKTPKITQRLFKKDSCETFGGYHSYSQTKKIRKIYFAQKEDAVPLDYEHTVYQFNIPKGYNDLIAYMPPPINVNTQTFTVRFENNKLIPLPDERSILGDKPVHKSLHSNMNDDESKKISVYANNGLYPSVLKYRSPHDVNFELSDDLYPFPGDATEDNTQDLFEIVPTITSEVINQNDKHLIDVECRKNG